MSLFETPSSNTHYFSMDEQENPLARNSPHAFELDGKHWATVEHYYQAMKFDAGKYQDKIEAAESAALAKKLGCARFKRRRADLEKVKTTLMTRAVYTQARTHSAIANAILETGDLQLIENSQFDYYWGCGRDHRGDNHYGKVVMNVRDKLRSKLDT